MSFNRVNGKCRFTVFDIFILKATTQLNKMDQMKLRRLLPLIIIAVSARVVSADVITLVSLLDEMLDHKGPGCIVRFWMGGGSPYGKLRFYLDGSDEPLIAPSSTSIG